MKQNAPVRVTLTELPEPDTFIKYYRRIYDRGSLTNGGPYVVELEQALARYLGLKHVLACNNGTMAIMLAIHAAGLVGKKIALPPYTYVATLSALLWCGCEPVFVDIAHDSLCLSPEKLLESLNAHPDIAGVIPVHIYGLACDVRKLQEICANSKLTLIYDGAQAFGSIYEGRSLLGFGDYSICSFHATKLFHTAEGGCVIANSESDARAISLARAFGHINDDHYSLGINGKMNELQAAMGLCMLPEAQKEIDARKLVHARYDKTLAGMPITRPVIPAGLDWNHAYYPILLPDARLRELTMKALSQERIYCRRYFYPSLNLLPYLKEEWKLPCPVSEDAARRILCLPMYGKLPNEAIERIGKVMKSILP